MKPDTYGGNSAAPLGPRIIISPHSPHRLLITHPTLPNSPSSSPPTTKRLLYFTTLVKPKLVQHVSFQLSLLLSRHPTILPAIQSPSPFMAILPTHPPKTNLPMHGMIILQRNQDTQQKETLRTHPSTFTSLPRSPLASLFLRWIKQ